MAVVAAATPSVSFSHPLVEPESSNIVCVRSEDRRALGFGRMLLECVGVKATPPSFRGGVVVFPAVLSDCQTGCPLAIFFESPSSHHKHGISEKATRALDEADAAAPRTLRSALPPPRHPPRHHDGAILGAVGHCTTVLVLAAGLAATRRRTLRTLALLPLLVGSSPSSAPPPLLLRSASPPPPPPPPLRQLRQCNLR